MDFLVFSRLFSFFYTLTVLLWIFSFFLVFCLTDSTAMDFPVMWVCLQFIVFLLTIDGTVHCSHHYEVGPFDFTTLFCTTTHFTKTIQQLFIVNPGFPFRLTPMSFALRVTNSP